jgi:predicted enzyme related to lactoylglutathione lyase
MLPTEGEAVWRLASTASVYVVADRTRAGSALVTLAGDDLDEQLAGIARRGIATGTVETGSGGPRRAVVADPDGNRITFFENPRPEA